MAAVVMSAVVAAPGMLGAQEGKSLGTVSLPRKVTAGGQPLAAGTYTLRLLPQDLLGHAPHPGLDVKLGHRSLRNCYC